MMISSSRPGRALAGLLLALARRFQRGDALPMAQDDREAPSSTCDEVLPALAAKGAPVESHRSPEAPHCWDNRQLTEDSRRRVFGFLRRRLAPAGEKWLAG